MRKLPKKNCPTILLEVVNTTPDNAEVTNPLVATRDENGLRKIKDEDDRVHIRRRDQ
jgi:hypothetical protein